MSCIEARVSSVITHLVAEAKSAVSHIDASASSTGEHLQLRVSKVCDTAPVKWYPLLSDDGYVLYDINGVMLLAR
jgi:hypothetical protein